MVSKLSTHGAKASTSWSQWRGQHCKLEDLEQFISTIIGKMLEKCFHFRYLDYLKMSIGRVGQVGLQKRYQFAWVAMFTISQGEAFTARGLGLKTA